MARVKIGADIVASNPERLPAGRYAVLCHLASTTSRLVHILQVLKDVPHVSVELVLAPEHGFFAAAQDQVAVEEELRDPFCNAPIHSLYGADESTLAPSVDLLAGIDFVLADLVDIGSRYYTFAASAAYTMQTCIEAGVPFIVLDRPNPLGGIVVEGPPLLDGYLSFVGAFKYIATRHGMTIAELMRYYAAVEKLDSSVLDIVEIEGWKREQLFSELDLAWVYPSPNMPTFDTALVYPGGCLLEGTTLSEGRGTTRPFEQFGAPMVDPLKVLELLNHDSCKGALIRPVWFMPQFHKHAGKVCGGIEVLVSDPHTFSAVDCYIELIAAIRKIDESLCQWRKGTYEFVSDRLAIDLLLGGKKWRNLVEEDVPVARQRKLWESSDEFGIFEQFRMQSLIYE